MGRQPMAGVISGSVMLMRKLTAELRKWAAWGRRREEAASCRNPGELAAEERESTDAPMLRIPFWLTLTKAPRLRSPC